MIAMRMKKALKKKLISQDYRKKRSSENSADQTIENFCSNLTNGVKFCNENQTCDSNSRFRTISGCCNNLQNSDFGKSRVIFWIST